MEKNTEIYKKVLEWWCSGDNGISSEAIVFVMCGVDPKTILDNHFTPYPYDSDDFGRCYRLLHAIPEWKGRIKEMACLGKVWGKIADVWPKLGELYAFENHRELYYMLKKLIKDDENVTRVDLGGGVGVSFKA